MRPYGSLDGGLEMLFTPQNLSLLPAAESSSFDDVYLDMVKHVMEVGEWVTMGESRSVGSCKHSKELLNYSFQLLRPQDRLLFNPAARIDLITTVGRFVWNMACNDRVADISYYDEGAQKFSDDGILVPGSCDGYRLMNARIGLNQLKNLQRLLAEELSTRRGTMVIYHPEDAGRRSKDIPCAIAAHYSCREDGLHATTIMRSNRLLRVLPYDVFFYSLLAEVVAASLSIPLCHYYHFVVSLHIYEHEIAAAQQVLSAGANVPRAVMPPIPLGSGFDKVEALVRFEESVRRQCPGLNQNAWDVLHAQVEHQLDAYWKVYGQVLMLRALQKCSLSTTEKANLEAQLLTTMAEPFATLLRPSPSH
jgi:thymidylate synthase